MIKHLFSSKFFVAPLACALGFALSVPARADMINGLVDFWTVDVNTRFILSTVNPISLTASPYNPTQYSLDWGQNIGNGLSGLDITNSPSSTTVQTNGGVYVPNVSITHRNRTMPDPTLTLNTVDIVSTLTLTPLSPVGSPLPPVDLTFHITFVETHNETDTVLYPALVCQDGGNPGVGINNPGCADIFVTDQIGLSGFVPYDLDGGGLLPTIFYFVDFAEITQGLGALPGAACTSAGVGSPCNGFETREQVDTTITFGARIFADVQPDNHVPEPATLALVGLALAGLGLVRHRNV